MSRGFVVLLALSFVAGCSSSYEPARSPRIATVVDGGYPTFVKDGEHFGNPGFGTGLVDAVQGNPRAAHHAVVGRNLIIGGFVLDLVGIGAEVGGLVVAVKDNNDGNLSHSGLATGLVVGGLAAVIAGSVMILAGQPHVYDAINIYNDSLDARPPTSPDARPPTSPDAPTATLLGPRRP